MKVLTVIGVRPQFIKAALVSRVFALSKRIEEIIVHTEQHFLYFERVVLSFCNKCNKVGILL